MKEYLPEWKIYIWKKLLLDQSSPDRVFQPGDFMYFDEQDEKNFMLKSAQGSINRIRQYPYRRMQNPYSSRAIPSEQKVEIDSGIEMPSSDRYYKFELRRVMLSLVDLATEEPKCVDIKDIQLRKSILNEYRKKREDYLLLEKKKHVASIGVGRYVKSEPDARFTDPFCGLPEQIYNKVEKGKNLTLLEFSEFISKTDSVLYYSISFKLGIDKKNLLARLNAYIADFVAGELIPPQGVRLFQFDQQKSNILKSIQTLATKYGSMNMPITFEEVARSGGWIHKDEHHYRFYETIFALEKTGEIEIKDMRKEEVILSLINKPASEQKYGLVKIPPVKELSSADKKKLFILEKLKEEWDLAPHNTDPVKIKIAGNRVHRWMNEVGIDYYQLTTILMSFEVEDLIIKHESINPAM